MGLELICRYFTEETFENNTVIYKEGEVSECIYLIMSGEVKMFIL